MISPDGCDVHAIGGDRAPGEGDSIYYGFEHVKRWREAHCGWSIKYPNQRVPWYKRDEFGRPIETFKGKPFKSAVRIIFQNFRKIFCL